MKKVLLGLAFLSVTFSQSAYATGFSSYLNKIYQKIGVNGGAGAINRITNWATTLGFLGVTSHAAYFHFIENQKDKKLKPRNFLKADDYVKDYVHNILRKGDFPEDTIQNIHVANTDQYAASFSKMEIQVPNCFVKSLYPDLYAYDTLPDETIEKWKTRGIDKDTLEKYTSRQYYMQNTLPVGRAAILHEAGHLLNKDEHAYSFSPPLMLGIGYTLQAFNATIGCSLKSKFPCLSFACYNQKSLIQNIVQIALAAGKIASFPLKVFLLVPYLASIPFRIAEERVDAHMRKKADTISLEYTAEVFQAEHIMRQAALAHAINNILGTDNSNFALYSAKILNVMANLTHPSPHSRAQKIRQEIEKRKVEETQKIIKNL